MTGAAPKIIATITLTAIVVSLICCLLDPEYDPRAPQFVGDTAFQLAPSPLLSFANQPRTPIRGASSLSFSSLSRKKSTPETTARTTAIASIPPVQVLLCVEALCIDSKNFFRDQLMIAFNALGHDVMNLTVVPFGNAKITSSSNHKITCQHGFGECDTNVYEQCAIHLYPDPAQHVPYLACLFASLPMGHRDDPFAKWTGLEPCAHDHHLDFSKIQQCHDDPKLSWELQTQAAAATPTRHDHVPWVEINGQYMNEESHNLLQEVCNAYRQAGGHTAGCSSYLDTS